MGIDGYFDVWSNFYGTSEEKLEINPVALPDEHFAAMMNAQQRDREEEHYLQLHYRDYND